MKDNKKYSNLSYEKLRQVIKDISEGKESEKEITVMFISEDGYIQFMTNLITNTINKLNMTTNKKEANYLIRYLILESRISDILLNNKKNQLSPDELLERFDKARVISNEDIEKFNNSYNDFWGCYRNFKTR